MSRIKKKVCIDKIHSFNITKALLRVENPCLAWLMISGITWLQLVKTWMHYSKLCYHHAYDLLVASYIYTRLVARQHSVMWWNFAKIPHPCTLLIDWWHFGSEMGSERRACPQNSPSAAISIWTSFRVLDLLLQRLENECNYNYIAMINNQSQS